MREISLTLSGEGGEVLREQFAGEPRALKNDHENFGLEVFGHEFELGPAVMYAPQVDVVDRDDLLVALVGGTFAGRKLVLRAVDGYGFWIYLVGTYVEDHDERLRPVSLGLSGVADAPDVSRALEPPE